LHFLILDAVAGDFTALSVQDECARLLLLAAYDRCVIACVKRTVL
jgi:hypothetical protein